MGKPTIKQVLDGRYAMKHYSNSKIKVAVRKGPKGMSLFAKKPIRKGNVIAYYKVRVYKWTPNYRGVRGDMYSMTVYTKNDRGSGKFLGDIFEGSLEKPKYNIPFFAYFANEPSGRQKENAYLDVNLRSNYRKRTRVKAGDTMVYKLIANRNIKPGEEIVWCYGSYYGREYKANC